MIKIIQPFQIAHSMKIVLAALVSLAVFTPGYTETPSDPLTPAERAWLATNDGKIVIDQSNDPWAPIEDVDADGKPVGIAIDYYRLIEKKLNFRFKVDAPRSWEERLKRYHSKEIDVVNNLQKTPERSKFLLFTKPYIELPNVIIVSKNTVGTLKLATMGNMTISVTNGYAVHEHLKENHDYLTLIPQPSDVEVLRAVSLKSVDAAIMNLAAANYLIEKDGISNLRIAGEIDYANALCLASRSDLPILNRILEKGLASITPAERNRIYRKWIHFELEPFYKNPTFQIIGSTFILLLIAGFYWTVRLKQEINQRKAAEKTLRESDARYRQLVNTMLDGMAIADQDGIFQFVNSAFCNMYRYSLSETIGMHAAKVIHPDYHHVFEKFLKELKEVGHFSGETIDVRKDGTLFHTDVKGSRIKYKGRECFLAVIRDITGRKKVEEKLQDIESRYRRLFKNSHSVMLVIDPVSGNIIDANPAACTYYGWSLEAFTHKKITDINMLTKEQIFQEMEKARLEHRNYFKFQHRLANGNIRDVEVYSGPIIFEDQELLYSIIHDITERTIAEKEREKLIVELQAALTEVKTLQGIIPICAKCKKIRDDDGYWQRVEKYIQDRSDAEFSHGLCNECSKALYGDQGWYKRRADRLE